MIMQCPNVRAPDPAHDLFLPLPDHGVDSVDDGVGGAVLASSTVLLGERVHLLLQPWLGSPRGRKDGQNGGLCLINSLELWVSTCVLTDVIRQELARLGCVELGLLSSPVTRALWTKVVASVLRVDFPILPSTSCCSSAERWLWPAVVSNSWPMSLWTAENMKWDSFSSAWDDVPRFAACCFIVMLLFALLSSKPRS